MNVLMVAAELAPLVKVGGLADVLGALPAALARRGHRVRVVLPLYGEIDRDTPGLRPRPEFRSLPVRIGQRMQTVRLWVWRGAPDGVAIDLVECDALFGRPGIYADEMGRGFEDALERASCLCHVALMLPEMLDWPADVVHAHDVQAALAPVYRRRWYAGRDLPGAGGTVLTVHNLAHQEIHGAERLFRTGLPQSLGRYPGPFEFFGHLNLLKGGIVECDLVNTVSPTYAREVVADPEVGCGLEGVLAARGEDFTGILNGVDYGTWDPAHDRWIAAPYRPDDLAGKAACRRRLLDDLGLDAGPRPVVGMVGRLVAQKGFGLVVPLLDRLVAGGFTLVVLGTGERSFHVALGAAAAAHPRRIAFVPEFSEPWAHAIYAGSDLFLMPSLFEPCGLSQLYALRYGTPPVVRRTGGLADTVADALDPAGTGFVFDEYDPEALWEALERARGLFADAAAWRALQRRGMACDYSWDATAAGYEALYARLSPAVAAPERTR
ncbi:MAG TPA: glycogen synthase [Candidatus Krumholzibacteria bacterium]|nr:glycogen synthase [Candidatus Krumholzibacteria bacterium]HPD70945.1 glycogen synthase [Candidatus Krumholzibacteria bacterium]HRY39355.1 glycogen synthase [Candidatus Krumholzibacteria bacterium]